MRTINELLTSAAHWLAVPPTSNSDRYAVGELIKELRATPAPLTDAELAELADMEQQATPAPWTHWVGSGKIFYGEADKNKPGQYSPANLQLFNAEDYDREDLDTEVEGFNIQPGLAEDDARFVAAMRNALPVLLARLAATEAKAASLQAFKDFVHTTLDNAGVDKHEEQNATTGCRVGARLDDLVNGVAQAEALVKWYGQHTDGVGRPCFEDLIKLGYLKPAAAMVKGGQPHA